MSVKQAGQLNGPPHPLTCVSIKLTRLLSCIAVRKGVYEISMGWFSQLTDLAKSFITSAQRMSQLSLLFACNALHAIVHSRTALERSSTLSFTTFVLKSTPPSFVFAVESLKRLMNGNVNSMVTFINSRQFMVLIPL